VQLKQYIYSCACCLLDFCLIWQCKVQVALAHSSVELQAICPYLQSSIIGCVAVMKPIMRAIWATTCNARTSISFCSCELYKCKLRCTHICRRHETLLKVTTRLLCSHCVTNANIAGLQTKGEMCKSTRTMQSNAAHTSCQVVHIY